MDGRQKRRWTLRAMVPVALITLVISATSGGGSALHSSAGTNTYEAAQQAAAESMRGMPDMLMGDAAATTVQGPTNLASNVGGSWNNYAFTIPNDPSCPSGVGTQQATDDHTTVKACPNGANGSSGAVHAVQLYDGKVLIMSGSGNQWQNLQNGKFTTWVWNPQEPDQTKAWKFIPTPYDMFCAGHVELSNGNVLITGGTTQYPQYDNKGNLVHDWDGSKQSYIFDVQSEQYVQTGSMANARWYPTVISVGGGKILVTGGVDDKAQSLGVVSHQTDTSELYDPTTGKWTALPTMDFSLSDPAKKVAAGGTNSTRTFPFYPGMVLLKGGNIFYSGESNGDNGVTPGIWNWQTGAWTPEQQLPFNYQRNAGATILLPPAQDQKVMVMGGGDYSLPTIADTEIMNLSTQTGGLTWTKGPALSAAKMYVGAVILPDYNVFETGGASTFRAGGVHTADEYNPQANTMTVMNSPLLDRLYHSSTFLEPNGTVAVIGSQPLDASNEMHISIYSPPYLFKTARPTMTGTINQFDYSGTAQGNFTVNLAAGTTLKYASLIRPSATTHSTDPDQRLVQLKITQNADGTYSFAPPTDDTIAPEGQYMLFVTDSNGVPSVASWVSLGVAPGGGAITPPPTTTPTPTPTITVTPTPTPTPTPTITVTPTPTPTPTVTPAGFTLTKTSMKGWVAIMTVTGAPANSQVTLQSLINNVWTKDITLKANAQGTIAFTWGGGTPTQERATDGSLTSNTVTVVYGP